MRALAPAAESGHQSPMNLKTLIVDDEPLAIERMQILCACTSRFATVRRLSTRYATCRHRAVSLSAKRLFYQQLA